MTDWREITAYVRLPQSVDWGGEDSESLHHREYTTDELHIEVLDTWFIRVVHVTRMITATDNWTATVGYVEQEGRPELWDVQIFPGGRESFSPDTQPPLNARLFRKATEASVLRKTREALDRLDPALKNDPALAFLWRNPRTGAKAHVSIEDHAILAWAFDQTRRTGARSPWKELAWRIELPYQTVKNWGGGARLSEVLTEPGTSGTATSTLTQRGIEVLTALKYDIEHDDAVAVLLTRDRVKSERKRVKSEQVKAGRQKPH